MVENEDKDLRFWKKEHLKRQTGLKGKRMIEVCAKRVAQRSEMTENWNPKHKITHVNRTLNLRNT